MFITHEDFTPQKYVHSSIPGSAEGGYPLCEVRGRSSRRKNCLVNVYFNFIVNMDRSLQGRRSNSRNYVRVFFPRRKPSVMREMYCGYVLWIVLYSKRGYYERKKRKVQQVLL
jgi:hypothetical protein